MKRVPRRLFYMLLGFSFMLAACSSPGTGGVPTVTSVTITGVPASSQLAAGATVDLGATVSVSGGASQEVDWSSSDTAVATVNNDGVVTAVATGTVDITATSQADATKSDTVTLTIVLTTTDCSNPEELPSTINDDTTLNAGRCYRAVSIVDVNAELTIQPGVTILVDADKRIDVESKGHLIAVGTASQPIVIKGATSSAGFWGTLRILSGTVVNRLENVIISDGGNNTSYPGNVWVSSSGKVSIKNSTFSNSARYGLYVSSGGQLESFSGNSFSKNNIAMYLRAEHMGSLDNASVYNDGNAENYLDVDGGATVASGTWPATNAPFRVLDGKIIDINHDISVEAGARIEFEGGSRMDVETAGSLKAVGTAASRVVFTGTATIPGAWDTIRVMSDDVNNVFDFVEVSYGGDNTSYPGNIWLSSSGRLNLTNSVISNSKQFGVYVASTGELIQSGNTFAANTSGDIGP